MEKLINKSCGDFLETLAAKTPVPGGGGASALSGALGTALGAMVANYTIGKPKYAAVEADVQALLVKANALRARLAALVDEDAQAFEPLSKAYALKADDPRRPEILEACLRQAAQTPMEILKLCCEGIDLHREMAEKGSVMVLSDVGTGAALCGGALYGAWLNVKVNTKLMTDRACAEDLNAQADALVGQYRKVAQAVYERVMARYS